MNLLLFGCQQIPWTSHYKGPETHNTSVFTSQGMNEILWKYFFIMILIQMIPACHKFAHVMSAES